MSLCLRQIATSVLLVLHLRQLPRHQLGRVGHRLRRGRGDDSTDSLRWPLQGKASDSTPAGGGRVRIHRKLQVLEPEQ